MHAPQICGWKKAFGIQSLHGLVNFIECRDHVKQKEQYSE